MLYVLVITRVPLSGNCVSYIASAMGMPLFADEEGAFHLDKDAPNRRIRIEPVGQSLTDWEDEPAKLARIESLGPQAHVYAMHYKSVKALRSTLLNLALCSDYILDDDYELFVDGREFTSLCRQNPDQDDWWLGGIHEVRYRV